MGAEERMKPKAKERKLEITVNYLIIYNNTWHHVWQTKKHVTEDEALPFAYTW